MRAEHTAPFGSAILAGLLGLGFFIPSAWAQSAMRKGAGIPQPTPGNAWLLVALLSITVVGLVAVLAKAIDLKHQREEEAVHLEAQITDAMMRDRMLASLPVAPTVHIPLWRRTPTTVEMHGQVPTGEIRQVVLHVAAQEAARLLVAYYIRDRITVVPSVGARAA